MRNEERKKKQNQPKRTNILCTTERKEQTRTERNKEFERAENHAPQPQGWYARSEEPALACCAFAD